MAITKHRFDLVIVGGGVNGAGIAMDAAGRGLKVALCEMNDIGSATSSNSSKLIHGGLRYLEYYEFRLVKEALAERETLLRNAPHIMHPLRFILPHRPHLRPAWMIRIGLFLYDNLAKRKTLGASEGVKFDAESPLKSNINKGFKYSDGWVDDARLVVNCALAAQQAGASIMVRTKVIAAERQDNLWHIQIEDQVNKQVRTIYAKALVNAAGPWVSKLFKESLRQPAPKDIRMVKGSHMIVPRMFDHEEAYILQSADGRIVFVIPYEDDFSLIGTTDVDYQGDPKHATISQSEIDYLLGVVNDHFKQQITSKDMIWSYSGVRPLMDDEGVDAKKASRDYSFEVDSPPEKAPLISIFGGKITTYRKLSEAATDEICQHFPHAGKSWTTTAPLPGGKFESQALLIDIFNKEYPWLPKKLIQRYVRTYGTYSRKFLKVSTCLDDLGINFGNGLYQAEVNYLIEQEWAQQAEDILWRRTKMGLRLDTSQASYLEDYISAKLATQEPTLTSVS